MKSGFSGSMFTAIGGKGMPSFSFPDLPKEEKGKGVVEDNPTSYIRDPKPILEEKDFSFITRTIEGWTETGLLDGFTLSEQEALTNLYNDIINHSELWEMKYTKYYLLAANYSFRALLSSEELTPSTKAKLLTTLKAKKFIIDMNNIFNGVLEVMKKFFPNSDAEFGVMCLFSYSYAEEQIACERILEQIKNEIFN